MIAYDEKILACLFLTVTFFTGCFSKNQTPEEILLEQETKAKEINSQKSLTLENFIKKYGKSEGTIRWEEFCRKRINPYSEISQVLFKNLDKYLSKKYTTYYATKNLGEWFVKGNSKMYYLDFFIKELNICIEFNGNAWHGNPKMFKPDCHCHPIYKDITLYGK